MFTLDDLDLTEDLAFLREHGSRFLPGDPLEAARDARPGDHADDVPGDGATLPEADARAHPDDYLIVV